MRLADTLLLSTRMFKARMLRTFLTVLGMSIGIAAVLFLVSLGYGLQKTLLERITTSDSLLTLDISEVKGGAVSLNTSAIEILQKFPEVQEVSSVAQLLAQVSLEDVFVDISASVTDQAFFRLGGIRLEKGSALNNTEPDRIVISSALATVFEDRTGKDVLGTTLSLKFFHVPEGESTQISEQIGGEYKYVIGGVVSSEENMVYVHKISLGDTLVDRFAQAKVKVQSENYLTPVRDKILNQGFLVSSLSDTVDQANKIFSVIQLVLMSFGVIALVVSAIGMFNTMTIALLERTEEIGIMKSIGASDSDIAFLFILESTLMGFLGGLGGVVLGFLGGKSVNFLINFLAVRFGGQTVNVFSSPTWFILFIVGFGALVGLLTGFLPARLASKIDPLDALRYK